MTAEPFPDVATWARLTVVCLEQAVDRLNAINVIPVPDADTGSNALLTIAAGQRALVAAEAGEGLGAARAFADGCAGSARGNSGVIVGQYLRGLVAADHASWADRLAAAAAAATAGVSDPQQGTILSVAGAAALAARGVAQTAEVAASAPEQTIGRGEPAEAAGSSVHDVVAAAAVAAVARTGLDHPVLRATGTVDAGACVLAIVLLALAQAAAGRDGLPDLSWLPSGSGDVQRLATARLAPHVATDGAFEVIVDLSASSDVLAELHAALAATPAGSVVIAPTADGVHAWSARLHLHTDDVLDALAAVEPVATVGVTAVRDVVGACAVEGDMTQRPSTVVVIDDLRLAPVLAQQAAVVVVASPVCLDADALASHHPAPPAGAVVVTMPAALSAVTAWMGAGEGRAGEGSAAVVVAPTLAAAVVLTTAALDGVDAALLAGERLLSADVTGADVPGADVPGADVAGSGWRDAGLTAAGLTAADVAGAAAPVGVLTGLLARFPAAEVVTVVHGSAGPSAALLAAAGDREVVTVELPTGGGPLAIGVD